MSTADKIALFSAAGGWFSAIATFAAVCISLHIANRRPKVSISCSVAEYYSARLPDAVAAEFSGKRTLRFVSARITNQSNFIIRINSVGLHIKDKVDFIRYPYHWDTCQLPQNLAYGEDATIFFTDDSNEWIAGMREALISNDLNPENIRCSVYLSTGETFYFPLDKKLLAKLNYK